MLIPLSEDNLSDKIIFNNNTSYLILMLGAVGYLPVVSPHRIKQVCKPYRVVKVAAEWYSVGSLEQVCKPYQVVKVATEWYSVGSLDQ